MPSQAFVWQRTWRAEVGNAVRAASPWLETLHVLVAEVRFKGSAPDIIQIEPDWSALKAYRGQVGAVVRIHASAAKTNWDKGAITLMTDLVEKVRTRFATTGITLSELQIDYDCPESRLSDYTRLVRLLKSTTAPLPVRITAMPSWLKQSAVHELLAESPGYVLQVHSLHLPQRSGLHKLIDMTETQEAVRKAVAIGVPFRVALPTYSCVVLYDETGGVKEVYGEDVPANLPLSSRNFTVLDADAFALADLMSDWRQHAPDLMQAVIWYRLPVNGDRLNWPGGVLEKIVRGQALKRGWSGSIKAGDEGHVEVILHQDGDAPDDLPREVLLEWPGAPADASDGLRGYAVKNQGPGWLRLQLAAPTRQMRVPPGQNTVIGWLRLAAGDASAKIRVSMPR